jgi:oxygen-independent coproporphyrinogen-3 oxidase
MAALQTRNRAGIYIHVPFCLQKCVYCDFYSVTDSSFIEQYIVALEKEIITSAQTANNLSVDTLYVGGGTPSILSGKQLGRIVDTLHKHFDCSNIIERTIECNPGTVTHDTVKALSSLSFNRISLGVQSFSNSELKFLGRIHSSLDAVNAVKILQDGGFSRLNVDILFGIPGQSLNSFLANLDTAVELEISHLSVYGLTIEEGTPLSKMVQNGEITAQHEELYEASFLSAHARLEREGFNHYEISNYALNGCESLHNMNCWRGHDYYGFGPAAHSRMDRARFGNIQNIKEYLISPCEKAFINEVSDEQDRLEKFMLGLRTSEGIRVDGLASSSKVIKLVKRGLLDIRGNLIRLTKEGMMLIDEIILILEEEQCLTLR